MTFKVGDEVRYRGFRGLVDQGPYESTGLGTTAYAVTITDGPDEGRVLAVRASEVEADVLRKGDRVTGGGTEYIIEAGPFIGHGEWYAVKTEDGRVVSSSGVTLTLVERAPQTDTYTHDGVTYDLDAGYRDRDGDVWRFERRPDGSVRGNHWRGEIHDESDSLAYAAEVYGPLTKV